MTLLPITLWTALAGAEHPEFLPIEDDTALPRVLLLGDSISVGYTLPVRAKLAGEANVHRPQENCGPTSRGVARLDTWLGDGQWDVIHFNFGIWDTHWMKNDQIASNHLSIDKDTHRRFTTEEHLENMSKIVAILKKPGATLIWGSTTPYVSYGEDTKLLLQKNNDTDKELMLKEGVTVNDLYNFALPNLKEWQSNDGCHFKPEGYDQLAQQVASTIADVLTKQAGETSPNTKNYQ